MSDGAAPRTGEPGEAPFASRAYARYVLGILFLIYVVNFIDRQIFAILLDDIKAELGASDTVMGMLSGLAFALFYTTAGIPIARWADRGSRRTIITLGLALWSAMTAVCGLVRTVPQMFLARMLVGVGEAAGSPPSHSLISDYFPPERRARALSVYAMGIYVGVGLGFLVGGAVREVADWRTVFLVVGLPGIPLALLARLTLREPPRGMAEGHADTGADHTTGEVTRFLWRQPSFRWLLVAASCQSLSGYAVLAWGAPFLGRVHGLGAGEIGLWFGLVTGFGGALGAVLGGVFADRLSARDPRWMMWLPAAVSAAGVPFAIPFLLLDDPHQALLAFIPFYVIGAMYVGPLWTMAQNLVKVRMRALASALLLFVLNLAGLGIGPVVVGALNDAGAARFGDESIRYSLLAVTLVGALASVFFLLGSRTYTRDLQAARD